MSQHFSGNILLVPLPPAVAALVGTGQAGTEPAQTPTDACLVLGSFANLAAVNGVITAPQGSVVFLADATIAQNSNGATTWALLATTAAGAWTNVAVFLNGWTTAGTGGAGSTFPASFRLDGNGNVELRGDLVPGVLAARAFTLPVGFRPPTDVAIPVALTIPKAPPEAGAVTVVSSLGFEGDVIPDGDAALTQLFLDGAKFSILP